MGQLLRGGYPVNFAKGVNGHQLTRGCTHKNTAQVTTRFE
ncbi:hypothetical protein swp_3462 [Shewanella piezotolerans WP3]|uniref:Uncharacterized protein n=1 Tax=Shewanella piezotolerans (strain WP3 / JCM 13877) TaxID=225849 RepID=B8CS03_SHEPW|nr:hypothetical protein swp_3462 [Shewanella piezotolerans WP3]